MEMSLLSQVMQDKLKCWLDDGTREKLMKVFKLILQGTWLPVPKRCHEFHLNLQCQSHVVREKQNHAGSVNISTQFNGDPLNMLRNLDQSNGLTERKKTTVCLCGNLKNTVLYLCRIVNYTEIQKNDKHWYVLHSSCHVTGLNLQGVATIKASSPFPFVKI